MNKKKDPTTKNNQTNIQTNERMYVWVGKQTIRKSKMQKSNKQLCVVFSFFFFFCHPFVYQCVKVPLVLLKEIYVFSLLFLLFGLNKFSIIHVCVCLLYKYLLDFTFFFWQFLGHMLNFDLIIYYYIWFFFL